MRLGCRRSNLSANRRPRRSHRRLRVAARRRSLDGSRVGESSRARGALLRCGNSRESRSFERWCRSADVAMGFLFDIVPGVANWAFLHVNLDRSRFLAEAEVEPGGWIRERQVGAQSGGPLGLQLTHRSSCKVRSFPADRARRAGARARRRSASRSPLLGMSIAQVPVGSGDSAGRWGRKGSAQGEGWT